MKLASRQSKIFADICLIIIYNNGKKSHHQLHTNFKEMGYRNFPSIMGLPQLLKYFPYFQQDESSNWVITEIGITRIEELKIKPPTSRAAKIPEISD